MAPPEFEAGLAQPLLDNEVTVSAGIVAVMADAGIAPFDHAAIGRALGCDGVRPSSVEELDHVVGAPADLERPFVIDVPMSLAMSFRDVLDPIDDRRADSGGY